MFHLANSTRLQVAALKIGIPAEPPPAPQADGLSSERAGRAGRSVKIAPRVEMQVARRRWLTASVGPRSMPAVVNAGLDEALPSLEEVRPALADPAGEGSGDGGGC